MATVAPLIAVIGETASGKSALALHLAECYNGEIISADSRTVYQGMNIGTAKPSAGEQQQIQHHLLDIITPEQTFTAADFQRLAKAAIQDIQQRGKLPILVGGTGLYVDSILYDFTFRPVNTAQRLALQEKTVEELQQIIREQSLEMPQNSQNPRHLVRAIETAGQPSQRKSLRPGSLVVGLRLSPEVLKQRVIDRVNHMFAQGLESEVGNVVERYGWQSPGTSAIGYQEFRPYFEGKQSLEQTKQQIILHTQQYAKRQRTWFKRNSDIVWCDSFEQATKAAEAFLTTKDTQSNKHLIQ